MGKTNQIQPNQGQIQKQQVKQTEPQTKRKIIKKVPFKTSTANSKQDQLKDWKPTKIQKKKENSQVKTEKQQNIAQSFLSSLSKPVHKKQQKSSFFYDDDQPVRVAPKPLLKVNKPTPEQIKWDIEDQTFIRKQFIPNQKLQHNFEQNEEQDDQIKQMNDLEVRVKVKGVLDNTTKIRHVDLTKVIDHDWQESAQRKIVKNQLWQGSQGLLEGRGNLAKMARQAQEKAEEIQQQISKRSYQRKQMRNRYGW